MTITIAFIYISIGCFYLYSNIRFLWFMNPAIWFVINQFRYSVGTIPMLNCQNYYEDSVFLFAMLSLLVFFILGAEAAKHNYKHHSEAKINWLKSELFIESGRHFNALILFILFTSAIIAILYYYAIGYVLFIEGIKVLFQGEGGLDDPATMRLYSYAGDKYFAPGYVNQFKNTLFPILSYYSFVRSIIIGNRTHIFLSSLLLPVAVVFLLGTGQRGHFVLSGFTLIIFLSVVFSLSRKRTTILVAFFICLLFLISSLVIGRGSHTINSVTDYISLLLEIPNRLFLGNQLSGIVGFRYIYNLPTQWGREWIDTLLQMIPLFKKDSFIHIDQLVFEYLYKTTRGTAPLSLVGSLWYNFHWIGISIIPFLIGFLYQSIYHRLIRGPKTLFRLCLFSALTAILGAWGAGGINTLLNTGLGAVLILSVIGTSALRLDRHPSKRMVSMERVKRVC